MPDFTEVSMDELHSLTSADLMTQAANEKVIKTGKYLAVAAKYYAKRNSDTAEFNAGRIMVSVLVNLFNPDDPFTDLGSTYINTSPEPRNGKNGKLDGPSSRYAELAKAIGENGAQPTATYEAALQTAFMVKIRESYRVDEDELAPAHADARVNDGIAWVTVDADDSSSRDHYLELGLEPRVQVDRIYKVKS